MEIEQTIRKLKPEMDADQQRSEVHLIKRTQIYDDAENVIFKIRRYL